MIPVTNAVKNAVKSPVKEIRVDISWQENNQTQTISSEDVVISVKKEAEGYYLASAIRKITIIVSGTSTNLLGKRVTVSPQVKTGANTWGDIPWGTFLIKELSINEAKTVTTFTGYGAIGQLQENEYSPGALTFPTTVGALAVEIANQNNMNLITDLTQLPNGELPISEDLWAKITGTTYRDILEEITGATGTIAIATSGDGGDDELEFISPPISSASDTMTENNLIEIKVGEHWGVVNSLVLSRQPQNDNITLADEESIEANGRTDVVIANNEILDQDRETAIVPLFAQLENWEYQEATLRTEGHGYHEVGDRIDVTIAGTTYKTIITKSTIILDGGIKETLVSTIPEKITIDYAKSGGISKTVYNTSLEVDKQNQQITSIVSRQDITDQQVSEQFTQIQQDLTNITQTVQTAGGGNLVKNSVGYGKDVNGNLYSWDYGATDPTKVTAETSPGSINHGALSGNQINMTGEATIKQTVAVTAGQTYTASARFLKDIVGSGRVKISNDLDEFSIELEDQTEYDWQELSLTFMPNMGSVDIEIIADAGSEFSITDLMLAAGDIRQPWRQSVGEIYNTQVSLDANGVQVRSNVYTGDYVEITPLEFAGYSTASGYTQKVFSLNRDTTEVEKLKARSQLEMEPIKIVPIQNSSYAGWAWVPTGG